MLLNSISQQFPEERLVAVVGELAEEECAVVCLCMFSASRLQAGVCLRDVMLRLKNNFPSPPPFQPMQCSGMPLGNGKTHQLERNLSAKKTKLSSVWHGEEKEKVMKKYPCTSTQIGYVRKPKSISKYNFHAHTKCMICTHVGCRCMSIQWVQKIAKSFMCKLLSEFLWNI